MRKGTTTRAFDESLVVAGGHTICMPLNRTGVGFCKGHFGSPDEFVGMALAGWTLRHNGRLNQEIQLSSCGADCGEVKGNSAAPLSRIFVRYQWIK